MRSGVPDAVGLGIGVVLGGVVAFGILLVVSGRRVHPRHDPRGA
jgi:hypothetical protein